MPTPKQYSADGEPRFTLSDISTTARAAWLYYEDGLTQAEVARQLHISRQSVGRLLEAARQQGIVRIEFDTSHLSTLQATKELAERLRLDDVVIVPDDGSPDHRRERLAVAGAGYLRRFLHQGVVVGVGWGDTIARTLARLPNEALNGVTFASAAGGVTSVTEALRENTTIFSHLKLLPAPVLVSTAELARQLNAEASVREVLDLASSASLTITSVGGADAATASSVRNSLVTADEAREFVRMGGVGDMIGEWFDAEGRALPNATSSRRIGLPLDQLRQLPRVICVAGGLDKVAAIRGAVAGSLINVLITDETTASALLRN